MAGVSAPSGFGVTISYDRPDMGAGTQTPVLCMNSVYSPLSHLSRPLSYFLSEVKVKMLPIFSAATP